MHHVAATSTPVVAAVVRRGENYLICRRPQHKRHGGLWEFPGGKIEPGESFEEALARELREELGVTVVRVGERLLSRQDASAPFRVEFYAVEIAGDPEPLEHSELLWGTATEIAGRELAPTDREFVETVLAPAGARIR